MIFIDIFKPLATGTIEIKQTITHRDMKRELNEIINKRGNEFQCPRFDNDLRLLGGGHGDFPQRFKKFKKRVAQRRNVKSVSNKIRHVCQGISNLWARPSLTQTDFQLSDSRNDHFQSDTTISPHPKPESTILDTIRTTQSSSKIQTSLFRFIDNTTTQQSHNLDPMAPIFRPQIKASQKMTTKNEVHHTTSSNSRHYRTPERFHFGKKKPKTHKKKRLSQNPYKGTTKVTRR